MKLKIKKLNPDATAPSYAHPGDAGLDLYSCEDYLLRAGERHKFNLGISAEFEVGYVVLFWDKSGLSANFGLKSLGGVIDCGYRGEWALTLLNTSNQDYQIKKGDKIGQALIQPVVSAEIEESSELSDTARGAGGFGSTGR